MLLRNTQGNERPSAVLLDRDEEGKALVRLAANIREEVEEGQTMYRYDEVVFELGSDRTETAEDIAEQFEDWWTYGENADEEEAEPTLEERVALIEELLLGGMMG